MDILTTGRVVTRATDYEARARQARKDAKYALAKELGLSLNEVGVTADACLATINVDVLLRAVRRIHAQYEAKTMGELGDGGRV